MLYHTRNKGVLLSLYKVLGLQHILQDSRGKFCYKSPIKSLLLMIMLTSITTALAVDTITITAPAEAATVSGKPLSITGTSSQPSTSVRVTINTTITGFTTTDISGNWSLTSSNINNGNYTVTADLINGGGSVLATDTNSFTVSNGTSITIVRPADGDTLDNNSFSVSGTSSLASTTVNFSIDGTLMATTTTDANGNWSLNSGFTTAGSHTLLAQLIVAATPVASHTISVTASIPIVFPTGRTQIRFVGGTVPTTGSGSSAGYSYTNPGSNTTTVTFSPAFSATPIVVATGFRASSSSTITLSAVSTTAVNLMWNTGTTSVHFYAFLFS